MKPLVTFKPFERKDNRFAIQVVIDGKPQNKFIHWIETTDGKLCTINRPDMVMSPVWSIDECQANCNWLNDAYLEGKIK